MKTAFADTFYSLALLNRDDRRHEKAVHFSTALAVRTVTTAWVLTEVADALAGLSERSGFLTFLKNLQANANVTIIPPSPALFDRGLELYARRPDKEWPLTDCISFEVMRQNDITDALTGDHHFEQAGFEALLKLP